MVPRPEDALHFSSSSHLVPVIWFRCSWYPAGLPQYSPTVSLLPGFLGSNSSKDVKYKHDFIFHLIPVLYAFIKFLWLSDLIFLLCRPLTFTETLGHNVLLSYLTFICLLFACLIFQAFLLLGISCPSCPSYQSYTDKEKSKYNILC